MSGITHIPLPRCRTLQGQTITPVSPNPADAQPSGAVPPDFHAADTGYILSYPQSHTAAAVVFNPEDPNHVFVAFCAQGGAQLGVAPATLYRDDPDPTKVTVNPLVNSDVTVRDLVTVSQGDIRCVGNTMSATSGQDLAGVAVVDKGTGMYTAIAGPLLTQRLRSSGAGPTTLPQLSDTRAGVCDALEKAH